jgi:hypothetical protein
VRIFATEGTGSTHKTTKGAKAMKKEKSGIGGLAFTLRLSRDFCKLIVDEAVLSTCLVSNNKFVVRP